MQSLSAQQLLKRRRFVGWFNAGFYGLATLLPIAAIFTFEEGLDVSILAFVGVYGVAHIVGGLGCALEKRWGTLVLWPVCILDLIVFPLGTLMGGYSLYILYETRDQAGVSGRTLAITSIIPGVLLGAAGIGWFASDSDSEKTNSLSAAIAAQGGTREFQRWMKTLPTESAAMVAAIARVQAQGLLRLDPATQLAQVRLTAERLQRTPLRDCASFGRGTTTLDQQRAFLAGYDSASQARLMEIKARAILSELRDSTPATSASDRDISDYALFVYQSLSPADQRRYQTLATSIAAASDTDVCWLIRLFHSRAVEEGPSQRRWVRVVLSQAAGGNRR